MRTLERMRGVTRAPRLTWDVLFRGRYSFNYDEMPITLRDMSVRRRLNLFRAGGNLLHRRLNPWSMPLHMQIELANYCNLRCPVCPTGIRAVKRKRQAIEVELFDRVMDQVGPYLLTLSLWAWGEPLLHPRLEEILRSARKHPIALFLSTNGQLLNQDRVIEALTREPPTFLIVALDGLTDETNSQFRVGAKLAPAFEGIRRIREIRDAARAQLPVLHMRFIVMKHNEHQLPDLVAFARDHGFDLVTERTLSIIDSGSDAVHAELVPEGERDRAYDYRDGERVRRDDFICQEPFWFPTVFADGTLVPCEQDFNARLEIGRVSEETSFGELWRSSRAAEARRIIRDDSESLSFCRNCPYRDREGSNVSVRAHFLNDAIRYEDLVGQAPAPAPVEATA